MRRVLRKGSQVFVEGKAADPQVAGQTGNDRYTTEIIADNMQMLGGRAVAPLERARTGGGSATTPPKDDYDQSPAPAGGGRRISTTIFRFRDRLF